MNKKLCVVLVSILSIIPLVSIAADDDTGLTGAIYSGAPSGSASNGIVSTATAISGAQAYVRAYPLGRWMAPQWSDAYGRFTFSPLQKGTYQLRIYRGPVRLWDQVVNVPAVLRQIVVRDIVVAYYVKPQDEGKIAALLGNLSYPYEFRKPEFTQTTNTLWFGDDVQVTDVKALAASLMSGNVTIRAIRRFKDGSGAKAKLIEIGASSQHINDPALTPADIRTAVDWPRAK